MLQQTMPPVWDSRRVSQRTPRRLIFQNRVKFHSPRSKRLVDICLNWSQWTTTYSQIQSSVANLSNLDMLKMKKDWFYHIDSPFHHRPTLNMFYTLQSECRMTEIDNIDWYALVNIKFGPIVPFHKDFPLAVSSSNTVSLSPLRSTGE